MMTVLSPTLRRLLILAGGAVFVAGCGGSSEPHLARADVAPLISLSQRIAAEGACAQARDIRTLQSGAQRLVNERRVPRGLQAPLLGGVSALAAQTPACVPAVIPVVIPSRGHGKGHGHEGHGDEGGD